MAQLAPPQPPKVPNEGIYRALKQSLDDSCIREVESLRATRGLSHESSAVLSCVFDDLKAKVLGGIRQGSTIDASSTITEPMDEHQLRERMALLTRKTEEMHHEVMVLRETVPAKVRESCAKQMEVARPVAPAAAEKSSGDVLSAAMDVDALTTRMENTTETLKELKQKLTGQVTQLQGTAKVVQQELGPVGGKMNAKAAAAVGSGASGSGSSRMKERNRGSSGGRHAPY